MLLFTVYSDGRHILTSVLLICDGWGMLYCGTNLKGFKFKNSCSTKWLHYTDDIQDVESEGTSLDDRVREEGDEKVRGKFSCVLC